MARPETAEERNPLYHAGKCVSLDWPRLFDGYAKKINPLTSDLLKTMKLITMTFAVTGVVSTRHGPPDCLDRRAEGCGNAR